ncbi:MFHAS1 [Branchiostoma lanceolatum]|uniref:Leucine-rich repeat protein SHOC-2 n=1 Tax=Branchiostoma lanceolatum TaxID=7740 RepID=A0A8J9VFF7_BRALA|nr:MFHAS1 [Branchiostoma lanceolatum]
MATPLSLRHMLESREWEIGGKRKTLWTLNLSEHGLPQLPDELYDLEELEALVLDGNKGIKLSNELKSLSNLKVLSLSSCSLDTVPAVVMKLQQLESLQLKNNKNIIVPDEMSGLVSLTALNLDDCNLNTVPAVVMKLTQVKELILSSNNNITLPNELSALSNLTALDIGDCDLDTVPTEVIKLTQLETLILSSNNNITLPHEMSGLSNLTALDLGDCNLDTIPAAVMKLTHLTKLNLYNNKNIILPDEMSGLSNLTILDLEGCNLDTVPPQVWKLTQLERLYLSYNPLQTLPAEIGKLTNIKHLHLHDCQLHTLPPQVWRLTQLELLDLSSNPLQTLPAEVGQLTNVKHLDLSYCKLHTLPPEVLRLTQLEQLDLRSNPLQTLPAEVGQLTKVEQLFLSNCKLHKLPPEVWGLTQLEWLYLYNNPLQTLPAEIGQLTNVKDLDLSDCQLHTLPPELWGLTRLEWLDLSSNPLQTLPAEVGQLTNVKHLDLSYCKLHTLPPEVLRLTQLEQLDLRSNPLQTLPAEVGQLTNVKHLELFDCELHTLPPEVGRLTRLERLDLSSNPLQTLPAEIGQLTNVKDLDLSDCQLHTLPPELWGLTRLEWLDLSSNPLQTLPAEVGQLTRVEHLDLDDCQLRTLPPEVGRLTQLEWLDLRSNPLQTLPAEVGQLTNVYHLSLSDCQLHNLPPELGRLTQLEQLDLEKNDLTDIPREIGLLRKMDKLNLSNNRLISLPGEISAMAGLKELNVSENKLTHLPDTICLLQNLETFNATENHIEALPAKFGQLKNLRDLDVSGNRLIKPPAEVCDQGIVAIGEYFDELAHSEEDVSARLKIVVLGEKMAGKTSLVRTLRMGESTLTEEADRTHCVEITRWAPDDNITFEVYDFGGHDVYHLTHQFFLTQDALNVLTVNLNTYSCTEQCYTEAVGFWLNTLNARVPGAVITIVGSKSDRVSSEEVKEKTRDIKERFTRQQQTWPRTIQQQITNLENILAGVKAQAETDHEEVKQQLQRTRQLLTRPLRFTGVCCVSSAEPTSGLDTLKSHILDTANNSELFPTLRRVLPRTWVDFEQQLRELRDKGTKKHDSYEITMSDNDDSFTEKHDSSAIENDDSSSNNDDSSTDDEDSSTDDDDSSNDDRDTTLDFETDEKPKWMTRTDCLQRGQLVGLTADRLEPVLSYLQQVGTILRYTNIPELKDLVFHDPSGLIYVIKELFHHDLKEVFSNKYPRLKGFSNTKLKKIRKDLSSRGYLPKEIVIALLGPHATPVGNVKVITNLMEHFGLCYTERSDEQDGETSTPSGYCIPWYIREERPATMKQGVQEHEKKELTVTCDIARFCPRGLFERLSVVVNKLIRSRQDWKDVIVAVRDSLPVIVYRETKDEHVNIIMKLSIPAQTVQGTQAIWDVISPLKDKLTTLLQEWPGLLYLLVYSAFTQVQQPKLTSSTIIPTFEVGPRGCTVQHSGVALEFPEGSVRQTRFISVEVETVPVTDDVQTNFTAMSAVLTVEQDFPQRFLRPVTVRLPWVWTQPGQSHEETTQRTETVVLHYDREHGWTVFPTNLQEGPETVIFETDRFQSYVVTKVKRVYNEIVQLWGFIWNGYCQDKVYLIVMPNKVFLPERFVNLLCVHKLDDASDFFSIGYVSPTHMTKQRISMTNRELIKAYLPTDYDIQIDPRDLRPDGMIFEFPPADRNRYSFAVEKRTGVPEKDIYQGRIIFERLDLKGNVKDVSAGGIDRLPVMLHSKSQGATSGAFVPQEVVSQHQDTGLRQRSSSQQHQQAGPEPTASPPPRQQRQKPSRQIMVAIAMVTLAIIVHQFFTRLSGGGEKAPQNETSKLWVDKWLPLEMGLLLPISFVAGLFSAIFGIWLFVFRKGPRVPIVLLLSDEYGTSNGGISTINRQVGQTLTKAKAVVYATALRVPKQDQEAADRDGVTLIEPDRLGKNTEPTLDWLTYYHSVHYPNLPRDVTCIIGHADSTDTAARNIWEQRYPQADLMTFNHVIPEDTEYYKGGRKAMKAWEKEKDMLEKVGNAKAAFSVGKRIYDHFSTKYKGDKKPQNHYIFLPKPSELFLAVNVRPGGEQKVVLTAGRVRTVEKLKGHDLAAQAMGEVVKEVKNTRLRVRGISEDDWETSLKILEDNLNSPDLNPTRLPYGTQEDIRDDMMTAHLVLMPSHSEPFGLVGLEAIAAGIPVLISDKTGLAGMILDLIKQKKLSPEHRHVIVETSVNDSNPAGDARRWAGRIVDILKHSDSEFEKAARFKRELVESRYWEESHRTFLQACGITAGDPD